MDRTPIAAKSRTATGTTAVRKLRAEGLVPGVVYGEGYDGAAAAITVTRRDLHAAITHSAAGRNAIFDLAVDGGRGRAAILKELQSHPVKGQPIHVDFLAIRTDQAIHQQVPVLLNADEAVGVKNGGVLVVETPQLTVEALPGDLPSELIVDIVALDLGESLRAGEVELPEGLTLVDDPDTVVASITAPSPEIEEEPAEAEAADGEETAEGEGDGEGADSAGADGEGDN